LAQPGQFVPTNLKLVNHVSYTHVTQFLPRCTKMQNIRYMLRLATLYNGCVYVASGNDVRVQKSHVNYDLRKSFSSK